MGSIGNSTELPSFRLSNKTLRIPNLQSLFQHWPAAVNPNLDCLRGEIDDLLERTVGDTRKLKGIKACDFAFLTCCLYPEIEWEELRTAGIYMLWIFLWDDEIDDDGTGIIAHSESHANAYCRDSLEYARLALGLSSESLDRYDFQNPPCPVPNMLYFRDASHVLRNALDLAQRKRLFRELQSYIDWTRREQQVRESGKVLTPDQYLELRNWTSGIYPVIATYECLARIKLDESLLESDEMKIIWKQSCFLGMIINDIHSARKELATGSLLNAIPVFYEADPAKNLDDVMAKIVGKMTLSIDTFDRAAARLESKVAGTEQHSPVQQYVRMCRMCVTGLLNWSLSTKRYGLARYRDEEGCITVPL